MRLKRGFRNIFYGLLNLILTSAIALLIPRLVISNYGSEVNGLISSVTQVFAYFSLLEAGVGLASIQALYKPISIDDRISVNKILSASNNYFKKSSLYYLISIVILSMIYTNFVNAEVSKTTIVMIIIITGLSGLVSFFFQNKYKILLEAEGKSYIFINLMSLTQLLNNVSRIFLLRFNFSIVSVQSIFLVVSILQSLGLIIYMKKNYSWLNLNLLPDYEAIAQKSSVLIHQVSGLVFNNTDIIILTIFTNLKVVSVYTLYNMLFGIVKKAMNYISNGVTFVFGQTFNNDISKFVKMFDIYSTYYTAFVYSTCLSMLMSLTPFMKLYTKGITDINYMDNNIAILFTIIILLLGIRTPSRQIIDIAGHFKKTQNRSIVESIINLVVTFILVTKLGLYGVLVGTIIALLYRSTDMVIYTNKVILKRNSWKNFKNWVILSISFLIIYLLSMNLFYLDIYNYFQLFKFSIIIFIMYTFIFLTIASFANIKDMKNLYQYFKFKINN